MGSWVGQRIEYQILTYKATRELHALLYKLYQGGEAQQRWAEPTNGANHILFFTFTCCSKKEPSLIPHSQNFPSNFIVP